MIDPIKIILSVDASNAIDSVTEFSRNAKDALEKTFSTSVDKAKAKIEELGRKMRDVGAIIDEDKKRIVELSQAKEKASGDEQKRLDQEIAALKRVIQTRELELLSIDQKRTKVTETYALSTAGSDAERDAIRKVTDIRNQEIGALKDQAKAHGVVNNEIDKGTSGIGRFATSFLSLYTLVQVLDKIRASFELTNREIDLATQNLNKLKDNSVSEADKQRPFFQEFGLATKEQQQAGQKALAKIAFNSKIAPDVVNKAMSGAAGALKDAGVTLDSDRFEGLGETLAAAGEAGLDTSLVTNIIQENKNLTGDQLRGTLDNILNATGGASRANSFLSNYAENKAKLNKAGVSNVHDALKMYSRLARTEAPQEIGGLMRMSAQSSNHFVGLSMQEKMALIEKYNQAQLPQIGQIISKSMAPGKSIDVHEMSAALSKLTPEQLDAADRVEGGTRGMVALGLTAGWENEQLRTGGSRLLGAVIPERQTVFREGMAKLDAALANSPQPMAQGFDAAVQLEKNRLLGHPDELAPNENPNSWVNKWHVPFLPNQDVALERRAKLNVLSNRFNDLQQLSNQVGRGEMNASPGVRSQMQTLIGEMMDYSKDGFTGQNNEVSPRDVDSLFQRADDLTRQVSPLSPTTRPTTAPSTQPTTQPVSINYHNRNVFYGASYDSIGAPAGLDNRYS